MTPRSIKLSHGLTTWLGLVAMAGNVEGAEINAKDFRAADLFEMTKVWTVDLSFTPEQWEAMEPKGGGGFFGGGGRGGGRGGGFGPGNFFAATILEKGDADKDTRLSREEFEALGQNWFSEWDKEKAGRLNAEQLRNGMNASIGQPGGGRGIGFNLQGSAGKRNGLASASGVEFEYVHADLNLAGEQFRNIAVRYKGNGTFMMSRGSIKRPLKLKLNEYAKDQRLAGVTTVNLHNSVTDPSWMNEVLSHRLFRDAGVPAPRTAYARVFVTVPGKYERQYFGLYSMVENIDNDFAGEVMKVKKGVFFKPVTPQPFEYLGDDWAKYNQTYDPKSSPTPEQKDRVIELCKLVSKADDTEFAARLSDLLDLDEFARFMAVTVWVSTMDSILGPGQNYYVYLDPRTQKFQFLPWDLDHSFGQFGLMGSQSQRENLSIHKPWRGENRFLERVFKVEAFKKQYLARLDEFNRTIFKPDRFHQQVDQIAAVIRPAVQEESEEKLSRFEKAVAGEAVTPGGFGGPRPGAEGSGGPRPGGPNFFQPAKPIKGFVTARAQSVIDQVAGKSQGETIGDFGFGGPGGRGGPGGGFGPGMMLGGAFLRELDANKDGTVAKDEFQEGFARWFTAWNTDRSGKLTEEQLRAGINEDLAPFRGGGPGAPGLGPPGGRPPGGE